MISGIVTFTVTATNTYGYSQVSCYVDDVLMDTQAGARENNIWTFSIDTTKYSGTIVSPGTHILKVIGFDLGGNPNPFTKTIIIGN